VWVLTIMRCQPYQNTVQTVIEVRKKCAPLHTVTEIDARNRNDLNPDVPGLEKVEELALLVWSKVIDAPHDEGSVVEDAERVAKALVAMDDRLLEVLHHPQQARANAIDRSDHESVREGRTTNERVVARIRCAYSDPSTKNVRRQYSHAPRGCLQGNIDTSNGVHVRKIEESVAWCCVLAR